LSVLPDRTALVVLDVQNDNDAPSDDIAAMVELAVGDAFAFAAVELVEVRGCDGGVVDRRYRHELPHASPIRRWWRRQGR
jgi:nicotinamidase-related amidase